MICAFLRVSAESEFEGAPGALGPDQLKRKTKSSQKAQAGSQTELFLALREVFLGCMEGILALKKATVFHVQFYF